MYYRGWRGLGAGPVQCSVTWDAPAENGIGVRQVGQPSRVRIRVSGLEPGGQFIIYNRHEGGGIVSRSALNADQNGVFDIYDTTTVGPEYTPGNYTTIVEAAGQQMSCGQFRIQTAPGYQPPSAQSPDYTAQPVPTSGAGRTISTGVLAPVIITTPSGPVMMDYPEAPKPEGAPAVAEAGLGTMPLVLAGAAALFFLTRKKR